MSRLISTDDTILNGALLGALALTLLRPRDVRRIAASPLVRNMRMTSVRRDETAPFRRPPFSPQRIARITARYSPTELRRRRDLTRTAGQRLNDSAAMLSFSVLADSAIEHYRGSFQNKTMYAPLIVAALALGASLFGRIDSRPSKHWGRDVIYALAGTIGFAGLGFHAYNVLKRPGRLSWLNLFYSAPIGAPMALVLSGLLGRGAERVRDTPPNVEATILRLPAGRMLAAVTATGLAGTVGEAGLLHFRGAYHNPAMMLPVTVPPIGSILLGIAALRPTRTICRLARAWLWLTAALGLGGVGFHAYGVSRNMGGWRNWSQNILNGPPLPAPPSFTGLAAAGLAALSLIEEAESHA
jgi:hypothetical protein